MLEYVLWCVKEEELRKRIDMKKVCVIGHFGFGENLLNGQTIKTKIVTNELDKQFGADQVVKIDTHGGAKALPSVVFQMIKAFRKCDNIIIFPAHNGIKIFVPLCNFINQFFHRKLHYVVIGGWLPSFLKDKSYLKKGLTKFNGIFVETTTMKNALHDVGLDNVTILRNFKDIKPLKEEDLNMNIVEPLNICTFSRVMKEKGIEDIVNAVKEVNEKYKKTIYSLDIYGPVDDQQTDWFDELQKSFPDYIKYKGMVQFDKSVEVLKDYFFLAFPTRFYTEGIPGTILDAYAAGVPVVASKWESFNDVVDDGLTGIGYEFADYKDLKQKLEHIYEKPNEIIDLKKSCVNKSEEYLPHVAIKVLMDEL